MSTPEVYISGLAISTNVISSIVAHAAEAVEGVVQVGNNVITSSLISVFTPHTPSDTPAVEVEANDDKLHVGVHVAVFYGYPFVALADEIRSAVAGALVSQLSCEIEAIDVYIDNLVFPKE